MKNRNKKRQLQSDFLELFIVLSIIFMIIAIYVPKGIWAEEEYFENKSRFNIQNVFDVESFYYELTDSFSVDGNWAIKVINAVRDSVVADSTFIGERSITLENVNLNVNIPRKFDVAFDTTFGFPLSRRDTIVDTIYTVVMYLESLNRNDTLFIPQNKLNEFENNEDFVATIASESKERSELIKYYDSYMPEASMLLCPLTNETYKITISEDKSSIRVASPITDVYTDRRYLIFAFEAYNHGNINDGIRSWD